MVLSLCRALTLTVMDFILCLAIATLSLLLLLHSYCNQSAHCADSRPFSHYALMLKKCRTLRSYPIYPLILIGHPLLILQSQSESAHKKVSALWRFNNSLFCCCAPNTPSLLINSDLFLPKTLLLLLFGNFHNMHKYRFFRCTISLL